MSVLKKKGCVSLSVSWQHEAETSELSFTSALEKKDRNCLLNWHLQINSNISLHFPLQLLHKPELETNSMSFPSRISSSFWAWETAQETPTEKKMHKLGTSEDNKHVLKTQHSGPNLWMKASLASIWQQMSFYDLKWSSHNSSKIVLSEQFQHTQITSFQSRAWLAHYCITALITNTAHKLENLPAGLSARWCHFLHSCVHEDKTRYTPSKSLKKNLVLYVKHHVYTRNNENLPKGQALQHSGI